MGLYDTAYDFGLDTSNLGGAEFDSYGGDSVHFVRYTFDAANGISATISLEEEHNDSDYVPQRCRCGQCRAGLGRSDRRCCL